MPPLELLCCTCHAVFPDVEAVDDEYCPECGADTLWERPALPEGTADALAAHTAHFIARVKPCRHDWKYVNDWYGDPNVINGTADCSLFECTLCGEESEEVPEDFHADFDDYDEPQEREPTDRQLRAEWGGV